MFKHIAATLSLLLLLGSASISAKPSAYVTVSPTPTHVSDSVIIAGCGYGSRPKDIYVELYGPSGEYRSFATHTDGDTGCFTSPSVSFNEAGWYEIYVFPDRSKGDGPGTYAFNHALVEYDFQVLP